MSDEQKRCPYVTTINDEHYDRLLIAAREQRQTCKPFVTGGGPRWMIRCWRLLTRTLLAGMIWSLCAAFSLADAPTPSQPTPKPTARLRQIVELVASKECIIATTYGSGFELHVPVDAEGKQVGPITTSGPIHFTINSKAPGCQVRYNIKRVEEQ